MSDGEAEQDDIIQENEETDEQEQQEASHEESRERSLEPSEPGYDLVSFINFSIIINIHNAKNILL